MQRPTVTMPCAALLLLAALTACVRVPHGGIEPSAQPPVADDLTPLPAAVAQPPTPPPEPPKPPPPPPKVYPDPMEDRRALWQSTQADGGAIRTWLMCGLFPNPPRPGQAVYDHKPPCVGFETDYLTRHGGDAGIRPREGMMHGRPDGTLATWFTFDAPGDVTDLNKVFKGENTTNKLAYAWAAFQADAGPGLLSVGSDDGVKVWLNGEAVHEHLLGRGVAPDQDLVEVTFRQGINTVLLKVENGGGGFGVYCRPLRGDQLAPLARTPLAPKLDNALGDFKGELVVVTDGKLGSLVADPRPVTVTILAPRGRHMVEEICARGDMVRADTRDWPDGPYWIRVSQPLAAGGDFARCIFWNKGPWRPKADQLLADAAEAEATAPGALRTELLVLLARIVRDRLYNLPGDFRYAGPPPKTKSGSSGEIQKLLFEYEEIRDDPSGCVHPSGFVRLAWRDETDDSNQGARLYLPPDYDFQRSWPLVINLHGYQVQNLPYLRYGGLLKYWEPDVVDRYGVVYLEPHGRGNTDYEGIGEADVLAAVRQAMDRVSIDPDRVYLMGTSMGGTGAWHLGTRHAHVFAALAPNFGGWDYRARVSGEELSELTLRERFLEESESNFCQAECLLTTPTLVNHGENDNLVTVENSRYAINLMQRWGYPIRLHLHPGKGHGGLGERHEVLRWLLRHRRDPAPSDVRIRSATVRDARAHWVAVERAEDPFGMIHVHAQVVEPGRLTIQSENALKIRLGQPGALPVRTDTVRVIWNGNDLGALPVQRDGTLLAAEGMRPWPSGKGPELNGPIRDVRSTPFIIVPGTISREPLRRRICALLAEFDRNEWKRWQHEDPRYVPDTVLTDAQLRNYSLILYGGPDANAVTRKLIDRLPLQITSEAIRIGDGTFPAADAGVAMAYAHPYNSRRYVLLVAGTSAKGLWHARAPHPLMDYVISDGRRCDGDPWERLQIVSGRFDSGWNYDARYAIPGDAARRAAQPVESVPRRLTSASTEDVLFLGDLLPARVAGSFLRMGINAGQTGRPITLGGTAYERGISSGIEHEPCVVEYDISAGSWDLLRAVIGIEVEDPDSLEPKERNGTKMEFIIRGDGKEIYKSAVFAWDSPPVAIEVDVTGLTRLELQVRSPAAWHNAVSSIDWADLRLVRR